MFVVIEGIDGSGKTTHAVKLVERLKEEHRACHGPLKFPRYNDTFGGYHIKKFLAGRYGQLHDNHPFLVGLLFALDRFESHAVIQTANEFYGISVLDRYVYANIAYQAARGESQGEQQEIMGDLKFLEFEIFKQPEADLVVFLDISPRKALARMSNSRDGFDINEADTGYQSRVRAMYLQMSNAMPSWHVVSCFEGERSRPIEEVHEEIWHIVQSQYPSIKEARHVGST